MECCDQIVLVITTSPVPSLPAPQLISDLLLSLPLCLQNCDLVITFDGFKPCENSDDLKGRAKRGQIPQHQADLYPAYILNIKGLFEGESPRAVDRIGWGEELVSVVQHRNRTVTFIEHSRYLGFALGVKTALKYSSRKFVMVLQHDWHFESDIPGSDLLRVMMEEEYVNYITFTSRRSTNYEQSHDQSHHHFRTVGAAARALRKGKPLANNLVSCFHFLDRPHLVETQTYRNIFNGLSELTKEPFKFRRGDFVEDTLGREYAHSIKAAQTHEAALTAWLQLGAWIYATESGERVVKHANGRIIFAQEQQDAKIALYIEQNRLARHKDLT